MHSERKRIGLVGIYHESNTFLEQKTRWEDFTLGHYFTGERILDEYRDAYHEIGGMIEVLESGKYELVPILYAEATPGGRLDPTVTRILLDALRNEIQKALPLDGVLVAPHGAAVSDLHDDFDGHWLNELRKMVGDIPVVGTLDPHANGSELMVQATNALVAYKTNPHIDQRQTGKAAAHILINTLEGLINPVQFLRQSRLAISIEQQYTATAPCLPLYQLAGSFEDQPEVLSVSILLGFPYSDVEKMGSSFLVVTNQDPNLAESIADCLNNYVMENRLAFLGEKVSIQAAIEKLAELPKPVLLLDMGDNVGGGSPGDSTFLLHALEDWQGSAFVCIQDPDAVQQTGILSPGDRVTLSIGGKSDHKHGQPFESDVIIRQKVDGRFSEKEPRHGGQVHFNMGPTTIVETPGKVTIMLTSLRTVPFSLQQLLQFGLEPSSFDVIVAKGVQAPIAAYGPVCAAMIRVDTDGVTTADMRKLPYSKRRKPLFPFERLGWV